MTEFVIDFNESLTALARFQTGITALGRELDKIEGNSNKSVTAASKLFDQMEKEYKRLETALSKTGTDAERLGGIMDRVRGETAKLMSGMAAANLKATVAAKAYTGEMAELSRLMQDTASKNGFVQSQQRITQLNNTLINQNRELQARIQALQTSEGKLNEALKVQLRHKQDVATEDQRAALNSQKLWRTLESLNSEQAKGDAIAKAMISARRAEYSETTRLEAQVQSLGRTYRSLQDGQQREVAEAQATVAARRQEITESIRLDAQYKQLQRTLAGLSGGRQEEIARIQAQIAARKRAINESVSEKKAVDELTAAIQREEAALVRLQAQSRLASGAHGQRVAQLKAEIAQQTRHNQLLAMSTGSLLGFSNAQHKVNVSQELGSQAAAMLRAGLTGLHASVGMYTSATVIAATATYGIAAAFRDSLVTGAEFSAMMSRTEAVMSSTPKWMKNTADANKAMELQVRALGQTTVFTASEVGEGLQQLGMAGFNASQAITALPGTLTLANLANVSMARSADIATNVLMTFNMQAKDLTGVVDLMATAVNNSNTDIEQLANALSYAGPAAQTAGISLKDTVAAVEALANSGIKGSRAGSALRRLFVSLLNPTKKGAEVIRQYGLDIVDAEGKTRSLTNIIGQLSAALKGVPGPERLAAIQNLVGVYATSPIAALVDQNDNFQKFRAQNEDTAGAGERMEKIISDNLKFDWKEMLSALEEVQLQAFDSMGMRLRELTASLSVSILSLMEPVKTVGDIDITGLDRLIANAQTGAEAFARVVAGIVAYKFASGNVFGAFAADAKGAAERLQIVADRAKTTSAGLLVVGSSADGTRNRMDLMTAASGRAVGAFGSLSAASAGAARALSAVATGLGLVMRALGWVGLIYGIGTALYEVFSNDTDQKVLDHKESVDEVKSSYEALKQQIEETGLARQRAAAKENLKAQQGSVRELEDAIRVRRNQIGNADRLGLDPEAVKVLKDDLVSLEGQMGEYQGRVELAKDTLKGLDTSTIDVTSALDDQIRALEEVTRLTNDLTLARGNLAATSRTGINNLNGQTNVSRIQTELDLARQRFNSAGQNVVQVRSSIPTVQSLFDKAEATAAEDAQEAAYKKTATVSQKLLDLEQKRNQELIYRQSLVAQDESARAANKPDLIPGLQLTEASNKRLIAIDKERLELQSKQQEQENNLRLAREASSTATRSDQENLIALRQRVADLDRQIKAEESPEAGKAVDLEKVTSLLKEQTQVRQQLSSIEKRDARAGSSASNKDAAAIKQALTAYEALAKKFDAVSYAQIELEKGTRAMTLLRKNNEITVEQEAKAIGELNQKYYEAVRAQDLVLAGLNKVRASLYTSPFSGTVSDLTALNRALQEGKVSLQEYNTMSDATLKARRDSVVSSLPKANFNVGDASSSPFTDWVSTEMERAQGLHQYEEAQKNLEKQTQMQMAGINQGFQERLQLLSSQKLIEQGQEQEHIRKMLEIQKDYNAEKSSLLIAAGNEQNAITTQQAQYAEQMNTMALTAAMGSVSNILGMFASVGEEATTAQKAAFIAQKAIAVAQIIMYTEMGAAMAIGLAGPFGIPLSTFIRATGYANAGLVAALAIGDVASGGRVSGAKGGSGSGGSTQMYDTGGFIPYNRTGIVGEYGPELVTGPAHVRGRGATSNTTQAGGGGGNVYEITLAPNIQLIVGEGGANVGKAETQQLLQTTKGVVMNTLQDAIRPQGLLDTWIRSR